MYSREKQVTRLMMSMTLVVTVEHNDGGWDHCVNGMEVLATDGELVARRILRHPRTGQNLYTHLLTVKVPAYTDKVVIRPDDSIYRYRDLEKAVIIPNPDASNP